jgi:hypothetical protein
MQGLHAYLERVLPEGVKALIVDHDTEITVISKPRFSHDWTTSTLGHGWDQREKKGAGEPER